MKSTQFKQSALMVAVAGLFAVPFAAQAMTVVPAALQNVPANIFPATTSTIGNSQDLVINAEGTDVFMGRTTGFNMVVTLSGAKFAAVVAAPATAGTAVSGWAVTIPGGGTIGSSSVTVGVSPVTGTAGMVAGPIVTFPAGSFLLDNTNLGTVGNSVTVTVAFNDPVGGGTLATKTATLMTSVDGVLYTAPTGTTTQRVDVGTDATHGTKTWFSSDGSIKKLDQAWFNAGTFSVVPTTALSCTGGNVAVSAASANCNAGAWQFASGADAVTVTVNGTDLTPFRTTGGNVYVVDGTSGCAAGAALASASNGATGSITSMKLPAFTLPAAGGSYTVCLSVPAANTTAIPAQTLSMGVAVDIATANVTDPSAKTGTLFPLQYNGSVREVYFFNPASNTAQTSVLRVVNPSTSSGQVTITGVRDDGTAGSGSVVFTLPGSQSKTLTATDLEAGATGLTGTLGAGAVGKKWHLSVTGEFPNMQVQSFTRDTTGILTNMSSTVPGTTAQNAN